MTKTVEAIYENGVLRPLQPLDGIAEHCKVKVKVEISDQLAHPLSHCVGILPDEDAEDMRRVIQEEFERVNLDDWQ